MLVKNVASVSMNLNFNMLLGTPYNTLQFKDQHVQIFQVQKFSSFSTTEKNQQKDNTL